MATDAARTDLRIRGVFSICGFTFKALSMGIYCLNMRQIAWTWEIEKNNSINTLA
jgi:hypothetical protein